MKTTKMTYLIPFMMIIGSCNPIEDTDPNILSSKDPIEAQIIQLTSFENARLTEHTNIPCEECDFIIDPEKIEAFDGIEKNVKPGDVICLQGETVYPYQKFTNLKGTFDSPITITNCDGRAVIEGDHTYGIKFKQCKNVRFIGNGDQESPYGIKVSTSKGFFITAEYFTTDIEIGFIEVCGFNKNGLGENSGFAGIGVKTSPYCDGSSNRDVWTCRNVHIHHNYIHDTGGEGMYIGHGFYNGRIEENCDVKTYSHSIQNIKIHDNIISSCGYDGIQIKNADQDVEVYSNIIYNYGTKSIDAHNEGLFIGEGTTGNFYNNWIEKGTGHGIQFQGMGNNNIFNNTIIDSGMDGFFGASGVHAYRIPNGYFNIFNNTIVNSGRYGFVFFNDDGGDKNLVNNLIIKSGEDLFRKGAEFARTENNLFLNSIEEAEFKDYKNRDLRPTINSPMVDKGSNLNSIEFDTNLVSRPQGNQFDIGSYEFEQ